MITLGIVLLIIAIILWGISAALAPRPPARFFNIASVVCGVIGGIVLLVGLALWLIPQLTGSHDVTVDSNALTALILTR